MINIARFIAAFAIAAVPLASQAASLQSQPLTKHAASHSVKKNKPVANIDNSNKYKNNMNKSSVSKK
ncbi:hypothetical protein ACFQ3K_14485 [Brucella gallinifaecis]|uniref:Uncharacterized protein n=1 Tax=Brucella gallinifaecis TaxID=215590 RepID=A0A502BUN0_9HYPH|nr:hypothetical protein [Brucella gallinifaecis]TPF76673.1 hypothetical protein FHY56_04055 [Brucella gallinifaecis]